MRSLSSFPRAALAVACALVLMHGAHAQNESASTVANSSLNEPLFFQLLIGEMEARSGEAGNAYQIFLDAARKTRDEALFRRATEAALEARSGEMALAATQAWRTALPDSIEAVRYQLHLLIGLNRPGDTLEPLRTLLRLSPKAERSAVILSLPRLYDRNPDKAQSAQQLEQVLQASLTAPETRMAAQVALGHAWQGAGDAKKALGYAQSAHALDPSAVAPALLGLELMATTPEAEAIVTAHLRASPDATPIRLVYARVLTSAQRYADAVPLLEAITRTNKPPAGAWLSLGALHLELKHPAEATKVLTEYLQRLQAGTLTLAPVGSEEDDDNDPTTPPDQGVTQAYLMLSRAAEQQGNFPAAEAWLAKVTNPQRALEVQSQRASLLAKQGKVKEGRELIRRTPEKTAEDVRAKLLAEAQFLRDVKQWKEANAVLASANEKFPNDADLLYEQSMMADKLNQVDEMEKLLRRAMEIKPDHHHAYNALGYALAERNLRLPEARELIRKALALAPGEPFITDSLGWVEYRMGNRDEALRLLQQAYKSRPDVEIGTHLGEVLWVNGQRDEARRVLRDVKTKDNANEVLKETLARLRVDL
jgi:tetratricopeptide (TPR) repeat protein